MRTWLPVAVMVALFWIVCGVIDYGLFTKRNNDSCLMWSRNTVTGGIDHDWCAVWKGPDQGEAFFMAIFGPISMIVGVTVASEYGPLGLEFTHIDHAYSGKGTER
jgi:hypothetical protein